MKTDAINGILKLVSTESANSVKQEAMNNYSTRIPMIREAETELDALEAELEDWRVYKENFAKIMSDEFHVDDEHHCTCVPMLRRRIQELEAVEKAAREYWLGVGSIDALAAALQKGGK